MDENDYWVHAASPHWQSKISFPKMFVTLFQLDLMPHSLISFK
jgi:hypothetical protein